MWSQAAGLDARCSWSGCASSVSISKSSWFLMDHSWLPMNHENFSDNEWFLIGDDWLWWLLLSLLLLLFLLLLLLLLLSSLSLLLLINDWYPEDAWYQGDIRGSPFVASKESKGQPIHNLQEDVASLFIIHMTLDSRYLCNEIFQPPKPGKIYHEMSIRMLHLVVSVSSWGYPQSSSIYRWDFP